MKQASGPTPSLATHMAGDLGRRIVAGGYRQGELVEDEGALASWFQISRSVVRDAVKILVGKGLLEVRRGIGTRVRPRGSWGLLDDDVLVWCQAVPPNRDYLRQLMDVRRVFEPKAARWAAERASGEEVAEIRSALMRMEDEKGSIEDFILADASFHGTVLKAAQNQFLAAMEGVIFSALLSSIRLTNKDPRGNAVSLPFHRRVYEAIEAGDGREAERCMERLLDDVGDRLERRLDEG